MEEKSRAQELSVREISLIRELAQIRKEHKRELEYEKFDGYELPPRTQFSMLNKPAVSIKYGVMKSNMACIRLFEGIKYVLPILHPNKKRLALIMCPEEDSASVEWARRKDENWVNKDITSLEFVENIFRLMNWNRECRYKVLGRVANSDQGLCMLFDLEESRCFCMILSLQLPLLNTSALSVSICTLVLLFVLPIVEFFHAIEKNSIFA